MFKRLFGGSIITIFILSTTGCFGGGVKDSGRAFDSAIINYEWEGVISGKETVYIEGNKTRSEINTATIIGGAQTTQKRVIINDGENLYKINTDSSLAFKETSPYKEKLNSLSPEEKQAFRKRLALLLNDSDPLPEPSGEETILDRVCEVYSVTGPNSTCLWEGITLRNEVVIDTGKAKQKAVSLETNVKLPADLFTIPETIKIQDVN